MKEPTESHIELFAKLSKILAETFQDIHQICLNEMSKNAQEVGSKRQKQEPSVKQKWLTKRQSQKMRESQAELVEQEQDSEEESIKPPKSKKNKPKLTDNNQQNKQLKQKKQEKKKKAAKWQQEGKPRPPLNAFMLFLRHSKQQIMEAKPQLTPSQVSSYASSLWNQLPEEDKEKYKSQYRENRAKYDKQLSEYNEKQRLAGKTPIKNKKLEGSTKKNGKDILDHEVIEVEQSNNSDSISGI